MKFSVAEIGQREWSKRALIVITLTAGFARACSSSSSGHADGVLAGAGNAAAGADGGVSVANGGSGVDGGASVANGGSGVDGGASVANGGSGVDGAVDRAQCLTNCPVPLIAVVVPTSRLNDVASIAGTAPCDNPASTAPGLSPNVFFIAVSGGEGTCHLTVSFLSGAPDFVTDVQVGFSNPCCPTQSTPQPSAIFVPEIEPVDAALQ